MLKNKLKQVHSVLQGTEKTSTNHTVLGKALCLCTCLDNKVNIYSLMAVLFSFDWQKCLHVATVCSCLHATVVYSHLHATIVSSCLHATVVHSCLHATVVCLCVHATAVCSCLHAAAVHSHATIVCSC